MKIAHPSHDPPPQSLDDVRREAAAVARMGNEFAAIPYGVGLLGAFFLVMAMLRIPALHGAFSRLGAYLFALEMLLAALILAIMAHVILITIWWRWAIRKGVDLHLVEEIAEEGLLVFRPTNVLGRLQRRFLMRLPSGYPETPRHSLPVSAQDLWS